VSMNVCACNRMYMTTIYIYAHSGRVVDRVRGGKKARTSIIIRKSKKVFFPHSIAARGGLLIYIYKNKNYV